MGGVLENHIPIQTDPKFESYANDVINAFPRKRNTSMASATRKGGIGESMLTLNRQISIQICCIDISNFR